MNKPEIAGVLKEIGFFMRFNGGDPSTAKTYQKAGEALLLWSEELTVAVQSGELTRVPHIGPTMAQVIIELVLTGTSTLHQQMCHEYPSSLAQLGDIPGLTDKQIYLLHRYTGVRSLADLRIAVRNTSQVLSIPGFGPRSLANLRKTLNEYQPDMRPDHLPYKRMDKR